MALLCHTNEPKMFLKQYYRKQCINFCWKLYFLWIQLYINWEFFCTVKCNSYITHIGRLDTSFFDVNISSVSSRPLDQWIWTFKRYMWPYFRVWNCNWNLIQLFRFASFIFCLEPDVRHSNYALFSFGFWNQLTM